MEAFCKYSIGIWTPIINIDSFLSMFASEADHC